MHSSGPFVNNNLSIDFRFRDVIYNKESCRAEFVFLPNSTTQMQMKLINNGGGYIYPEVPPNAAFCIPKNVILTKQ